MSNKPAAIAIGGDIRSDTDKEDNPLLGIKKGLDGIGGGVKGIGKGIKDGVKGNKRKKKKKKKKPRQKMSLFKLLTNWNFLFFMINIFTPILIFVWWEVFKPDQQVPYIVTGILGMLISITGFRHFNQLMSITKEANSFAKNNQKMKKQQLLIKEEVDSIHAANAKLKDTESSLRASNKRNQQNLANFESVQEFMQKVDVEDFKTVIERAREIGNKWHDELLRQERDMLHLIFDRYEMNQDDQAGMNETEFNKFASCLPDAYQKRFEKLGTFDKLSNNKGILDYADFEMTLDVFAEMIVDDVDIEVEIVKDELEGPPQVLASPVSIAPDDSIMSDMDDSDSEQDGGFLSKLNTWRTGRKQQIRASRDMGKNVSRRILLHDRTPTTPQGDASAGFGMFGGIFGGGKSKKKRVSTNALSPTTSYVEEEEDKIEDQPKTVKSVSAINAIHDVDDHSFNDAEMAAWMSKHAANDNDDDEAP